MKPVQLLTLLLIFSSCINKNEETIKVYSFTKNISSRIDTKTMDCIYMPLETVEDHLFADICFLKIDHDTLFLITKEQNEVLMFSFKDGRYLGQIGEIGNGPGEYSYPGSLHIDREKDEICIADKGQGEMIYYRLSDGAYIKSKRGFPFYDCYWLSNHEIAWIFPAYRDNKRKMYNIKITDEELEEKRYLNETNFQPAYLINIGGFLYEYNQAGFLNLPFDPVVYRITSTATIPVYQVDFGNYTFANRDWLLANASENYYANLSQSDYISACKLYETDQYISANFLYQGTLFMGFYNKGNGQALLMKGMDFSDVSGLIGMTPIIGTYQDYFVTLLYPSLLKKAKKLRDDLKEIADKISEEDNPVLCLFKFKIQ